MNLEDLERHVDSIYKVFLEAADAYKKADSVYEEAKAKRDAAKSEYCKWVARFDDMRTTAYALGSKRSW